MLGMSYYYDFEFFGNDLWPRRLTPLFCIGALFVPWYGVFQFSQKIAWLLLLNPTTYFVEGLRATFIGDGNHLALGYSLPMAFVLIMAASMLLARGVKKRFDPV